MIRTGTSLIVAALLLLAGLNVVQRWTWRELEDGVLWKKAGADVVASEIAAGTAAEHAGVRRGDVLLAIDGKVIDHVEDVTSTLHQASQGQTLHYTIARLQTRQQLDLAVAPIPSSPLALYMALATVGIFSLMVGASVRLRRPDHQATLHFFWLTVALFGVMAFSFTGKLDALDWTFYWGDLTASLLLPPLFIHFALVFPDRPDAWVRSDTGRALMPALYLPALLLGGVSVAGVMNGATHGDVLTRLTGIVQSGQLVYLAVSLLVGLMIMVRALRQVRSVTARRQLRWIVWGTAVGSVPFAFGYALPFAFGLPALKGFEYSALLLGLVPLAFASAIVRYRLMDVEVIIKRTLVYAAAIAAIAAIYGLLLWTAEGVFLKDSD